MGEGGFAKKFIKGPAEPFIRRNLKKGYYAKKVMGKPIDFNKYFLSYLTKGTIAARPVQAAYSVQIKALPTGANKEALLRPHATSLELQCAGETPKLINLNYPVRKTFNWSPQNCGDVIFNIKVGNIILTKKYTGYLAFPKFIKENIRDISLSRNLSKILKKASVDFTQVSFPMKKFRSKGWESNT
jgi:type VI secretion system protein ImpL